MWQVPQYVLVGVAEVFTAITYYDLFYSEVPSSMRSVCQAINMLTTSLGTMLGGTINSLCRAFLPNNLNEGNMEYVYFLIAILSAANLLVYIFVSRGFKYQSAVCAQPVRSRRQRVPSLVES
jgi:peptide/histidine transporter 3/4